MNSVHSVSPDNFNFRLNGEFGPRTSNLDAIEIASSYVCTTESGDAHAALSFARSEENVGVIDPNELDRGLRSMGGELGVGCEAETAYDMINRISGRIYVAVWGRCCVLHKKRNIYGDVTLRLLP